VDRSIVALVIEDHEESVALLQAVLEPAGFRVVATRSGEDARRLLMESLRPDVVLCDLVLPDEDGLAFVRWLRTGGPSKSRRVPAIAMTAFYERYGTREVREAGFDGLVPVRRAPSPIRPTRRSSNGEDRRGPTAPASRHQHRRHPVAGVTRAVF